MNITVRKAVETDFSKVVELVKEFAIFQQAPEKVSITVPQMIEDKDLFNCLIAENDGREVIGFATYFFAYYSWTGKALYLDDLYVKDEFRKRGVGKKLLETVISLANSFDCKKVRWQVSKWNAPAIAFYKTIGAVIDEVEINCDLMLS